MADGDLLTIVDGHQAFAPLAITQAVYAQKTTLTDAEIRGLTTVHKEVVPPPGAGKALDILRVILISSITTGYADIAADAFFSVVLDDGGPFGFDISLHLNEGTDLGVDSVSGVLTGSGYVASGPGMGADATIGLTQPGVQLDPSDMDDKGALLGLYCPGGPTGGNAANTLTVTVVYTIVDL